MADDQQRAARGQRRGGAGQHPGPQRRVHLEVGDEHELEGLPGRLVLAEVGDHPVHLAVGDAASGAQLAPLIQADPGEIDGGHRPAPLGQPDRVTAFAGRQVKRPAGREVRQFRGHELVRVHRPLELGAGVPLIPLLPVHPATLPDDRLHRQLSRRARPSTCRRRTREPVRRKDRP